VLWIEIQRVSVEVVAVIRLQSIILYRYNYKGSVDIENSRVLQVDRFRDREPDITQSLKEVARAEYHLNLLPRSCQEEEPWEAYPLEVKEE